jgi:hypothetical protein
MQTTFPLRALSKTVLACAAIFPFAIAAACGGDKTPPTVPTPGSATASATDSGSATSAVPPPDSGSAVSSAAPPPSAEPPPVEKKSKKADKKQDPSWADCHKSYKPGGKNLDADVSKMAKSCATVTKLKQIGKTLTGKQDAEGTPDKYPLAAKAGKCYRVFAESEASIKDLDLAIKDSNGDIAGEDSTDDPSPIVLEDGAVCFKEDDAAIVIVSVGAGKGKYALQIWGD